MENLIKITKSIVHLEHEELHSGQFMVSHLDEDGSISVKTPNLYHITDDKVNLPLSQKAEHESVQCILPTCEFKKPNCPTGIDESLCQLMNCLTIAYPGKITNPKWNKFSGIRFSLRDKIRLNNLIWREYHMQYIMKKRSLVVSFAMPFTDTDRKPEVVIMEGKYWKKRIEEVRREYRRLREERVKLMRSSGVSSIDSSWKDSSINASSHMLSSFPSAAENNSIPISNIDDSEFWMDLDFLNDQPNEPPRMDSDGLMQLNNSINSAAKSVDVELNAKRQPEYNNDLFVKNSFFDSLSPTLFEQHFDQIFGLDSESTRFQSPQQMKREVTEGTALCGPGSGLPDKQSNDFILLDDITDVIAPHEKQKPTHHNYDDNCLLNDLSPPTNGHFTSTSYFSSSQSVFNTPDESFSSSLPLQKELYTNHRMGNLTTGGLLPALLSSRVNAIAVSQSIMDSHCVSAYNSNHAYSCQRSNCNQTFTSNLIQPRGNPYTNSRHNSSEDAYSQYPCQNRETLPGKISNTSAGFSQTPGLHSIKNPPAPVLRKPSSGSNFKSPADKRKSLEFSLPKEHPARLNTLPYSSRRRSSQPNVQMPKLSHFADSSSPPCDSSSNSVDNLLISPIHQGHKETSRSTPLLTRLITSTMNTSNSLSNSGPVYRHNSQIDIKQPITTLSAKQNSSPLHVQQKPLPLTFIPSAAGNTANGESSKVKQKLSAAETNYASYSNQPVYDSRNQYPGDPAKSVGQWSLSGNVYPSPPNNFSITKSSSSRVYQTQTHISPTSTSKIGTIKTVANSGRYSSESNDTDSKRRYSIKSGLDLLHSLHSVGSGSSSGLAPHTKIATASLLKRTADLIRQLKQEKHALEDEEAKLRREFHMLQNSINSSCSRLPATGVDLSGQKMSQAKQWFNEYVRESTLNNWKFYIFSFIISDLFHEYNSTVSIASFDQLTRSIFVWLEQHASLVKMRPVVLRAMRTLSTTTSILTEPGRLPQQAIQAVYNNRPKDSAESPAPSLQFNSSDKEASIIATSLTNPNSLNIVVPKSCTKR